MSSKPTTLPDLDDDEFAERLKPLAAVVIPGPGAALQQAPAVHPEYRNTGYPAVQSPTDPEKRAEQQITPSDVSNHQPGNPKVQSDGNPDTRENRSEEIRNSGFSKFRDSRTVDDFRRHGLVDAAERLAQIEQLRGPKRRFEFLIPKRVGDALAEDAARQGKSATIRLLEILRDAGFPVIPEDLIDLRKERRR